MPKVTRQVPVTKPKRRTGSAIDRIEEIDEGLDTGLKTNFYGRSGTGKTTLWSTFPKPILALICSGGNKPGELRSINTVENRKVIKRLVLEKSSDIDEAVEYLKNGEGQKYKTAVLDHATGLQDIILKEVLGLVDIPVQLAWGTASQQQWGTIGIQMKERLRMLLGLSQNVVIVAQEREFDASSESSLLMPYVGSALSPSVTGWLNPAVDYICQTYIRKTMVTKQVKVLGKTTTMQTPGKGVEYCLRTAPDPVFTTKFRVPKGQPLPEEIVDPSYDKIIKLIKG
jgi:hypothetical protein